MSTTRSTVKTALIELGRLAAFVVLFVALYALLALALHRLVAFDALIVDSLAMLGAAVTAGIVLLRVLEARGGGELGFPLQRRALPQLLIGAALGVGGLLIAGVVLVAVGALRFTSDSGSLMEWLAGSLGMLLLLLIPAAAEEALFRGYPFQKLVAAFGAVLAVLGASAAFALAHAHNPAVNAFALANIFAAGVMLSVAFLLTRSLWFATGVHVGWNWSMAALLDLPVSGLELFDAPLYEPVDRGPAWLTGGAFGPEAGIAGLIGLLLVLAAVLWITRKTRWVT